MPHLDKYRKISAKTGDYAVVPDDLGKLFTNRGATAAINFTLPPTGGMQVGWWCEFFVVADYNVGILSNGSNDNIVTFNDAAADSLTFATVAKLIGGSARVTWDGTSWLLQQMVGETQTVTIA